MWQKKGQIYNVDGKYEWNKSHAQVPVVDVLADRLRIYYATRNGHGKSNVSFIEVSKDDPCNLLYENPTTLLPFGQLGTFDDSGIMPSSILTLGRKKYLYYVGWTTRQTVPYQNAVGLAVSNDDGVTFEKVSEGPVISVNHIEPYFSGTAFTMFEEKIFKMWYLSCIRWEIHSAKAEPLYNIKYAESADGVRWNQTGAIAIDLAEDEGGLVSASVIKTDNGYVMWYGKRKKNDYRENVHNSYRIGYAESTDGIQWKRLDKDAGITISQTGWDAEMISYPYVVSVNKELLMFYNGNGFGKSGFGYAIWK